MGDGLDVEVVGRLVEEEEVGLAHERGGEEDAAPRPGGERLERRVQVERQVARGPGRCGRRSPTARRPGARRSASRRKSRTGPLSPSGTSWGRASDPQAGLPDEVARVDRKRPLEHAQERGLAGAVAAEQAEALAGFDLEARAVEDRGAGELE
jgi:hypothetical protein